MRTDRLDLWRWLPLALGTLLVAGVAATELYLLEGGLGLPLDDSWIHLVFARSLAAGEGLAANPGEWVAGSTSPLWSALLALGFLLPGSPLVAAQLFGAALFLVTIDLARGLARDFGLAAPLAALVAALVAASEGLLWSSLSGMEVALFTALTLAGIRLHVGELERLRSGSTGAPVSLALLGLATLARPEAALLLVLAAGERLVVAARGDRASRSGEWARLAWGLAAAAALIAPMALFNWGASGSLLPTTFAAKAAEGGLHAPRAADLLQALRLFIGAQPLAALLVAGGVVESVLRRRDGGASPLLPALWLVGLPLAYSALSGAGAPLFGNFGRYLFPLLPLVALFGGLALARLAEAARRPPRSVPVRSTLAVAVALALAGALAGAARGVERYGRNLVDLERSHLRLARWLAPRLPPEALLAVNDLGVVRYLLPNRVLDLGGIASPEVPRRLRQRIAIDGRPPAEAVAELLMREGVDYVVSFDLPQLPYAGDPARYRALVRLDIDGNVTLAGGTLVLYETAWNRHPLRTVAGEPTR